MQITFASLAVLPRVNTEFAFHYRNYVARKQATIIVPQFDRFYRLQLAGSFSTLQRLNSIKVCECFF